jgi:hypothetical protein
VALADEGGQRTFPPRAQNIKEPIAVFRAYEDQLKRAQAYFEAGDLESAAVFAALATHVALCPHPGFFAAPRTERLLRQIGARLEESNAFRRVLDPRRKVRSILHVATELTPVGGLTNMLGHWIAADKSRMHSVALTSHRGPLHGGVADAVLARGGRIERLARSGGLLRRALQLRRLARLYDAVVLHVYGQDVVPSLAFAKPGAGPPVLLLNHGDHLLWLGVASSDVVINLRDAAQDLSIARRGVAPRRNIMVPTIVSPAQRTRPRQAAKRELGIADDQVLLFSAARGMKYRSVDGRSFADAHVDLLRRHPNALLWVLGAGNPGDWTAAIEQTAGRIRPMPESPATKLYFEAADIYVDSFPFVSSTSMMEAASLGTPLVSRFYGPKEARIFAINHPGIDAPTLHGATEAEYVGHLDALLRDADLRARKGEEARLSVLRHHTPPGWLDFVENAYALAMQLPPIDPEQQLANAADEAFFEGEPDRRLYEIFGYGVGSPAALARQYLGLLPNAARLRLWRELADAGAFENPLRAARALLPDWLVGAVKDFI